MTRLDQSKELMRRVQEILHTRDGVEMKTSPLYYHLLLMYSRVVSLYKGVALLLDAQLAVEALILSREMFTDSLQMMELERNESKRDALLLGVVNQSLAEWERMDKKDRSLREAGEEDMRIRNHVAKKREEIQVLRRRHGIGKLGKFGSEKQLTKDHDRLDEFMSFEFTHRMVHQPLIAQSGRVEKDPEIVRIHSHDPDDGQLANAGAFAMTSVLHAHKAVGSIFGWTETPPEQIDSLLAEIRDTFASEADES